LPGEAIGSAPAVDLKNFAENMVPAQLKRFASVQRRLKLSKTKEFSTTDRILNTANPPDLDQT